MQAALGRISPGHRTVPPSAKSDLSALYVDRRGALLRYFSAKTGSRDKAEDIVQDIYLRIEAMTEEAAATVENPASFLYRIGLNLYLDGHRRTRRREVRDDAWTDATIDVSGGLSLSSTPSPEDAAWARLKLDRVTRSLEGVTPKARQAFRLHKIDGLSHAETARRLGVSQSSVEKYLASVLARLLDEVGWP